MSKALVCRCEDVTLKEVDETLARGFVTVEEVKRMTGLGTGPCQGKECMVVCAELCLAARGPGARADELHPFTARPPFSPTPLGVFARGLEGAVPDEPPPSTPPTPRGRK